MSFSEDVESQNNTRLWDLDPSFFPQDPFLPLAPPVGPTFLDTQACLCTRQLDPGSLVGDDSGLLWRCVGNRTGVSTTSGKWFRPIRDDSREGPAVFRLPIYDASNPPERSTPMQWGPDSESLVPGSGELSVWDRACTGENHTSFSTSFYRAVDQIGSGEQPVDAAPCWRPGALPVQMQNVSHWESTGCLSGFLCMRSPPSWFC